MAQVPEDKCPVIIDFLSPILKQVDRRPLIVAISGAQGSGKTTLVRNLAAQLRAEPHNLNVVVFSIDDIYLTHEDQVKLAKSYPDNPLVQVRGEPGTHDVELGNEIFDSLISQKTTKIPFYDKSCFGGAGDRTSIDTWETVQPTFDVILFEGWCVGFRTIEAKDLEFRWMEAKGKNSGVIKDHRLEDLMLVNEKLRHYDTITNRSDALIHLDTQDLSFVYDWRTEQEHGLIQLRGTGMSDEQVKAFVDCYMPAYELYTSTLREGAVSPGRQLRLIIDKQRRTIDVKVI